ncbi:ribonuclease H-like protein [Aspergillus karnatakaensis]|uniref:putative ribonuclease H1 n=1 Tax=Aspergillus karnatakaensis TaxID=1810916 RepID=UPI003CCE14AE
MPYRIDIYTDGGCRGNGRPWAIGAAAYAVKNKWGRYRGGTRCLPRNSNPRPSSQRAEITGIILALEHVLEKWESLDDEKPDLDVTIYTDSKYAVGCMTDWIWTWANNGWVNSRGWEVANRDLIEEASALDDRVRELGDIEYVWIPREENEVADGWCDEALDRMEDD